VLRSEDVTADDIQIQSDRLVLSELAAERYATAVRRPPPRPPPAARADRLVLTARARRRARRLPPLVLTAARADRRSC